MERSKLLRVRWSWPQNLGWPPTFTWFFCYSSRLLVWLGLWALA